MADLRLPAALIAAELVNEDDRRAASGLFIVQVDAVVGGEGRHNASLR
jgi:hypothetical protein